MIATRADIVEEAKTWINTPYHHEGRMKGVGVDCAQLLYAVYQACSIIPKFDIPHYPRDWHFHRDTERYLGFVIDHTIEKPSAVDRTPLPGDVILWKFGRCFSHGAIVSEWPNVIHAYINRRCDFEDVSKATYLRFIGENITDQGKVRPMRVFSPKVWED